MLHALKTVQPFFNQVKEGKKTFELRKFDRPFKPGDTLILQEWNPDN
jgi:ASC-1-like (ASCH) protein